MRLLDWLRLPREQWKPARAVQQWEIPSDREIAIEIEKQIQSLESSLSEKSRRVEELEFNVNVLSLANSQEKKRADDAEDGRETWKQVAINRGKEVQSLETSLSEKSRRVEELQENYRIQCSINNAQKNHITKLETTLTRLSGELNDYKYWLKNAYDLLRMHVKGFTVDCIKEFLEKDSLQQAGGGCDAPDGDHKPDSPEANTGEKPS